jgi:hypothetical protein
MSYYSLSAGLQSQPHQILVNCFKYLKSPVNYEGKIMAQKPVRRLLLDMDDVLFDFVGGACEVWGITDPALVQRVRSRRDWNLAPVFSEVLGTPLMTNDQIFERINGKASFWQYLEPLPWLYDLVQLADEVADEWGIVTAPQHCETCYVGKLRSLRQHLGAKFNKYHPTADKHWLASPGVLLIDDREEGIDKFVAHNGDGLLFPMPHNRLRHFSTDPVTFIRDAVTHLTDNRKEQRYAPVNP